MRTVKDFLKSRPQIVYSVAPETTVFDALTLMAEKNIGSVLVLKNERLVGLMSERDYTRKIILKGKSSKETFVHEIMSEDFFAVHFENTIEECMMLMTKNRVRHLPVLVFGKVEGLISIGDVVKDIIEEQEFTIKQLHTYITS